MAFLRMPIIIILLCCWGGRAFAESIPSWHATELLKHCASIDDDRLDYSDRLKDAEKIINEMPSVFQACHVDTDCVVTAGACSENVSVSHIAKSCFDEASILYGSVIDCVQPEVDPEQRIHASCRDSHCIVNVEE